MNKRIQKYVFGKQKKEKKQKRNKDRNNMRVVNEKVERN